MKKNCYKIRISLIFFLFKGYSSVLQMEHNSFFFGAFFSLRCVRMPSAFLLKLAGKLCIYFEVNMSMLPAEQIINILYETVPYANIWMWALMLLYERFLREGEKIWILVAHIKSNIMDRLTPSHPLVGRLDKALQWKVDTSHILMWTS